MTPQFSVRLFRPADLDRILQIEHASFGEYAWDRNLFADYYHKCGRLFLVAVKDRNICGYILTCTGGRTDSAELVSLAVDPKDRGRGIATLLMDSTLRRLRRAGIPRVFLMVKVTNLTAIRFYERYDFCKGRLVRGYYEDGEDGRRYEKVLLPAISPPRRPLSR
ncbi:MAG TPA: N-acetyltransferase [Bryobacteraceae bacterium]|jgi:ribosomal protein S18 acetylase RimI-like enzyme|nr:N-acetyltransferase [Bryobacteraceae bacterium]